MNTGLRLRTCTKLAVKSPCKCTGYWAVEATEETAMNGVWKKGPGKDLFDVLEKVELFICISQTPLNPAPALLHLRL